MPPFLFLTGPTGSGKTSCVALAAAICGDSYSTVLFDEDKDRVRQSLSEAKAAGGFVAFDEYLKGAAGRRIKPVRAMELVLGLTPDSLSHKLYTGSVRLGRLPVCVWCDTTIPNELASHAQIGRRMHHLRLKSSVEWIGTLKTAGIGLPHALREYGSPEYIHAANCILSAVQDEWFPVGEPHDYQKLAAAMNVPLLGGGARSEDVKDLIRTLYAACCAAPQGPGRFVRVDTIRPSDLSDAWLALTPKWDKFDSQQITEYDLQAVLGTRCPTQLEVKGVTDPLIRFVDDIDEPTLFNGDLRVELATVQPDPDGHRDAEHPEHSERGGESVPALPVDSLAFGDVPDWEPVPRVGSGRSRSGGPRDDRA
jgi:hypothetical protein